MKKSLVVECAHSYNISYRRSLDLAALEAVRIINENNLPFLGVEKQILSNSEQYDGATIINRLSNVFSKMFWDMTPSKIFFTFVDGGMSTSYDEVMGNIFYSRKAALKFVKGVMKEYTIIKIMK